MTRDQFLTELMGEKWIVFTEEDAEVYKCSVDVLTKNNNPNFSLWPDKGRLLDFVMGQEWHFDFEDWVGHSDGYCDTEDDMMFTKYLIDNLAELVASYKGWKP